MPSDGAGGAGASGALDVAAGAAGALLVGAPLFDGRDDDECGMSRAHENAERYGDMVELSAVFEKGDSGPELDTEYRAGSLPSGYGGAFDALFAGAFAGGAPLLGAASLSRRLLERYDACVGASACA